MFNFFFNSPAWILIVQSDWMTKFVLFFLFLLSITCVAIIAFKFATLRYQKKLLLRLLNKIKSVQNFNELIQISKDFQHSLGGKFLTQNLSELKHILEQKEEADQKLNINDIEHLELLSDQLIDRILMDTETYLPILGTSASVAPFIGLFGTIWGLIHSFVSISQEKSADISVVAPGIAEALTTTLAGLIVAIPAMIAFHYFSNEIRKMEHQVSRLSDYFLKIVKKSFLK